MHIKQAQLMTLYATLIMVIMAALSAKTQPMIVRPFIAQDLSAALDLCAQRPSALSQNDPYCGNLAHNLFYLAGTNTSTLAYVLESPVTTPVGMIFFKPLAVDNYPFSLQSMAREDGLGYLHYFLYNTSESADTMKPLIDHMVTALQQTGHYGVYTILGQNTGTDDGLSVLTTWAFRATHQHQTLSKAEEFMRLTAQETHAVYARLLFDHPERRQEPNLLNAQAQVTLINDLHDVYRHTQLRTRTYTTLHQFFDKCIEEQEPAMQINNSDLHRLLAFYLNARFGASKQARAHDPIDETYAFAHVLIPTPANENDIDRALICIIDTEAYIYKHLSKPPSHSYIEIIFTHAKDHIVSYFVGWLLIYVVKKGYHRYRAPST